jgi:hypothetical protein
MARKVPKDRATKDRIVAFKVEEELAEFLDKLQNKSEFIRKAIIAQLGMACPLCAGSGIVPRGLHDHYAPVLREHNQRPCAGCGTELTVPPDARTLPDDDGPRLEQFLRGGPLYCPACYAKAPACPVEDCGWHIPPELSVEHHRKSHTH